MGKPTLKQIFDFAAELIDKEWVNIKNGKEYTIPVKIRRYPKQVAVYAAEAWFRYSKDEIASYTISTKNEISKALRRVNTRNKSKDDAEELYMSVMYTYNKSNSAFIANLTKDFVSEGGLLPKEQNEFEKWLINRLYEIENKLIENE